jgi:hypothetical protein
MATDIEEWRTLRDELLEIAHQGEEMTLSLGEFKEKLAEYLLNGDDLLHDGEISTEDRYLLEDVLVGKESLSLEFLFLVASYNGARVWNDPLFQLHFFANPFDDQVLDIVADSLAPRLAIEPNSGEALLLLASTYANHQDSRAMQVMEELSQSTDLEIYPQLLEMLVDTRLTYHMARDLIVRGNPPQRIVDKILSQSWSKNEYEMLLSDVDLAKRLNPPRRRS